MGKGTRAERELANMLWESGFAVMRSPASGAGRKHPQPDILISNGDRAYGIDTKSSSEDLVYISKKEVANLEEFCEKFGCEPMLGVRFDWEGWVFFKPENCETTENSYKVSRDKVGLVLEEGVGFRKQETL